MTFQQIILTLQKFWSSRGCVLEQPYDVEKGAGMGCLGVEMEAYGLYCNAARLNKRALTLLTVTDNFLKPEEKATSEERLKGLNQMIEIAILTAEEYAKESK